MQIGIIVHSDTGNTLQVAEALKDKLGAAGHDVALTRLEAVGNPKPGDMASEPASIPDVSAYDAVVFAAPVHAFSLSALMRKTLERTASLSGKRAALFVTHAFPFAWLGGNRALRQMARLAEGKGAQVVGKGVVDWPKHDAQIGPLTDELAAKF